MRLLYRPRVATLFVLGCGVAYAAVERPTATDVSATTVEDRAVALTLSASDPAGLSLTYAYDTAPLGSSGTVSCVGPFCTFTPAADWNGTTSFGFRVNNGSVYSNWARATVTVSPVADRPTAVAQSDLAVVEDTPRAITLSGNDPDGDTLTYEILAEPSNGTVSLAGFVAIYTPNPDYNGTDSFAFRVGDGTAWSTFALVTLTVLGTDDAPTAGPTDVVVNEDATISFDLQGADADGDSLRSVIYGADRVDPGYATRDAGGTFTVSGLTVTYTPPADFNGTDTFDYRVHDGASQSVGAPVTITVNPVNDTPVAESQTGVLVGEDTERIVVLQAEDVDGDTLSYRITDRPDHGFAFIAGQVVTYLPASEYSGSDSFSFQAWDGTTWSNTATVNLSVAAVNDAPEAEAMSLATDEDWSITFDLDATDREGDPLTPSFFDVAESDSGWVTLAGRGAISVSGTTLTYTPAADWYGTDSFSYNVTDGGYISPRAVITVEVAPVNDAPVANTRWVRASNGDPAHLVFDAQDVDGDPLTYSIIRAPRFGSAIVWNEDHLLYEPTAPVRDVDDWLTYLVSDGVASDTATVLVEVTRGPAAFPLDSLQPETGASAGTTSEGNPTFRLPGPADGCESTWASQPRFEGELGGVSVGKVGLVATHYDTLRCGADGYLPEYAGLYIVHNTGIANDFDVVLLDNGQNIEAGGIYLDEGALVFTRVGGTDEVGGIVKYTAGSDTDETAITISEWNPLGIATDSSPWYDRQTGTTLFMTAVVPEICGEAEGNDCGVVAMVDAAGELLDQLDEEDGHHAWGCGACVSFYGEEFCGFGPGADASGADVLDDHACALARIEGMPELPITSGDSVATTLSFGTTLDPGDAGCTSVASLESSFINGGLVSDGAYLYAVALGSDSLDAYSRVYQLDRDLTVLGAYEIEADYDQTFTNGFQNSLLVAANGMLYLTGIVDDSGLDAYALVEVDPDTGATRTFGVEVVARDNNFGAAHLYVDAAGDEVAVHSVGESAVAVRLDDGAVVGTWELGAADGDYLAAPLLIADGDGAADALLFVSTDNVVTILTNTGLADDTSAPWPGPRGGGFMQATVD